MNVFISCGKIKAEHTCQAKDMYQGDLFKKFLKLARSQVQDKNIYILSAKYGLLSLNDIISPYNRSLIGASKDIKLKWGGKFSNKLNYVILN